MANTTETVEGKLLWLRPAAVSARAAIGKVGAIEQALLASELAVHTVNNVYRALLHLVRTNNETYFAAVVCVDEMEHAELEFFTILAQHSHCPPIYAYGHERSHSALGRAVELGATGVATPELVESLVALLVPLAPIAMDDEPASPPSIEQETTPSAEPTHDLEPKDTTPSVMETNPVVDDELPPMDAEAENETDDTESDSPPRVPWRTYDTVARQAPRRQPPPQRTPPSTEPSSAPIENKPAPSNDYEPGPLLTEEELRALIGDDDPGADHTTSDTHGS